MLFEIIDENKQTIAITDSIKEGRRMLITYAKYTEWNRSIKIQEVGNDYVSFSNGELIYIRDAKFYKKCENFANAYRYNEFQPEFKYL